MKNARSLLVAGLLGAFGSLPASANVVYFDLNDGAAGSNKDVLVTISDDASHPGSVLINVLNDTDGFRCLSTLLSLKVG
jgi:hypothetical protein